jgi:hypothetical protein
MLCGSGGAVIIGRSSFRPPYLLQYKSCYPEARMPSLTASSSTDATNYDLARCCGTLVSSCYVLDSFIKLRMTESDTNTLFFWVEHLTIANTTRFEASMLEWPVKALRRNHALGSSLVLGPRRQSSG